eukprot:TRINITY_DN61138_c0_g1_i1.p1 TRINITY_DN61138_c0_g1~~TRINITY_DN61138_c0_g1_i1.p1  ORF type:complete len:913 (-),score=120.77 TRINITY_DN61138_c0_g1_i1:57-2795(-)
MDCLGAAGRRSCGGSAALRRDTGKSDGLSAFEIEAPLDWKTLQHVVSDLRQELYDTIEARLCKAVPSEHVAWTSVTVESVQDDVRKQRRVLDAFSRERSAEKERFVLRSDFEAMHTLFDGKLKHVECDIERTVGLFLEVDCRLKETRDMLQQAVTNNADLEHRVAKLESAKSIPPAMLRSDVGDVAIDSAESDHMCEKVASSGIVAEISGPSHLVVLETVVPPTGPVGALTTNSKMMEIIEQRSEGDAAEPVQHITKSDMSSVVLACESSVQNPTLAADESSDDEPSSLFPSAKPPRERPVRDNPSDSAGIMNKSVSKKADVLIDAAVHCPIEETMWDAALFASFEATGLGGTLFIFIGVVGVMILQYFVVQVILQSDAFANGSDFTVGKAETWRYTAAHHVNNLSPLTRLSLARRVCENDASLTHSTEQRSVLQLIEDYTKPTLLFLDDGALLCMLLVTLWLMIVVREIKRSVQFCTSVWSVPRSPCGKLEWNDEHKQFVVARVSQVQLATVSTITAFRIIISVTLGFGGSRWLAREHSVANLLLNAAALSYLFDAPSIVHAIIVPVHVRVLMQAVAPLPSSYVSNLRSMQWKGFQVLTVSITFIVSLCVALVMCFWILPTRDALVQTEIALCGNNLDFVWGVHPDSWWTVSADTSKEGVDDHYFSSVYDTVRELVHGNVKDASKADHSSSLTKMISWLGAGMENELKFGRLFVGCSDQLSAGSTDGSAIQSLRHVSQSANISSCVDMTPFCLWENASIVRLYCPVTCGCRDPRSGLPWKTSSHGCPREECMASGEYKQKLMALPCEDPSVEDLNAMPQWRSYWDQMIESATEWAMWAKDQRVGVMRENISSFGCSILQLPSYASLCFDHKSYASLAPFCPVTCRCKSQAATGKWRGAISDCPPSCSQRVG